MAEAAAPPPRRLRPAPSGLLCFSPRAPRVWKCTTAPSPTWRWASKCSTALLYLILVLSARPYRRNDLDSLAVLLQLALVLLLLGALNVQLFNSLDEYEYDDTLTQRVLGFDSLDALVAVMVALNLLVLAAFVFMMLYQVFSQRSAGLFRLIHTNQPPDLVLSENKRYHLFLSHIWSTGQDQCAVIKRQLNLLMPGISVFLDVDDLEDISALEKYVEQTQCMLLFQSRGYYLSRNCLRELDATLTSQKAFFLVHEADEGKGGAPLSVLKLECASKRPEMAEVIFNEEEQLIVPWHRVADFQLLTLRLIAERTCAATLTASNEDKRGSMLYAHDEIQRKTFVFRHPVVLYTSAANPGAAAAVDELAAKFCTPASPRRSIGPEASTGSANFSTTRRRPALFTEYVASKEEGLIDRQKYEPTPAIAVARVLPRAASSKFLGKHHPPAPTANAEATHMVLYLNEQTFAGEAGLILAHELREARRMGLSIEMLHECDPSRGGCEFAKFFTTTPEDLLVDGLYSKIANALHPGPHREVSFALCAKSLGAVAQGKSIAGAKKELARATKTMSSVGSFFLTRDSSISKPSTPPASPAGARPSTDSIASERLPIKVAKAKKGETCTCTTKALPSFNSLFQKKVDDPAESATPTASPAGAGPAPAEITAPVPPAAAPSVAEDGPAAATAGPLPKKGDHVRVSAPGWKGQLAVVTGARKKSAWVRFEGKVPLVRQKWPAPRLSPDASREVP